MKFHAPDTFTAPSNLALPFTVNASMLADVMALVAMLATWMAAFVIVATEIAAVGMVVMPVNAGLALGTLSVFNTVSAAARAAVSLLVVRVKSTTPDSTSDVLSFSTTSSSMSVLANAFAPTCVTLAGMVRRPLILTPLNAFSPMRWMVSGNTNPPSANSVRPLNAPSAISTTENAFSAVPYPLYARVGPA